MVGFARPTWKSALLKGPETAKQAGLTGVYERNPTAFRKYNVKNVPAGQAAFRARAKRQKR